MADDTVRQTVASAQPSDAAHDLHSQTAGGGELPREAPPAANSTMRNTTSPLPRPQSSLPEPSFLPEQSFTIAATTLNHRVDAMDGSTALSQDNKNNESTVPGASSNTPTGSSSSTAPNAPTTQVRAGGAPARVFMNEKIVPYLLEGMKAVTKDQPPNPLRVLGEFLIQKSNEVEGGATVVKKSPE